MNRLTSAAITGLVCLGLLVPPSIGAPGNAACLSCHSAPGLASSTGGGKVTVRSGDLAGSVHARLSCVDCHSDLRNSSLPHKADLQPARCVSCHKASHSDGIHRDIPSDKTAPRCQDCHGGHRVLPARDPGSPVNPLKSAGLCTRCHSAAVADAVERSLHKGIGCTECHPAHTGVKADSPSTCGNCHAEEYSQYRISSHGSAEAKGDPHAPTCSGCHGGHSIVKSSDPKSSVHPTRIAGICAECHADEEKMAPYGLPANVVETYEESYHGIALDHGDLRMPTCVTCHQAHFVLPSGDPTAATHKSNLSETCGACHRIEGNKVAEGKVHVVVDRSENPVLFHVSNAFKWLTIGTMVALVGHIILDLTCRACLIRRIMRLFGR